MNVVDFLSDVTDLDASECVANTELADIVGWESLAMVRLAIGLEGILGRPLELEEIDSLVTVGDVEELFPARCT